jgi:SAM-dependent methyltransferase
VSAPLELEPTGERMMLEQYQDTPEKYLIYLMHIATYRFAAAYTADKRVLDFGSGSGYGSAMIADAARSVIGVDVSAEAVDHARTHHTRPNLAFQTIEPSAPLPFADGAFETVLSFQVIEHVRDAERYLAEIVRVLVPGGTLVLATPDRTTRLFPAQRPWNRFHVVEYDRRALHGLLARHFAQAEMLFMGGRPDVIALELRRTRKLKWATLLFTLPIVPDTFRVRTLAAVQALRDRRSHAATRRPPSFGFGEADLAIGPAVSPAVNLLAVARRA